MISSLDDMLHLPGSPTRRGRMAWDRKDVRSPTPRWIAFKIPGIKNLKRIEKSLPELYSSNYLGLRDVFDEFGADPDFLLNFGGNIVHIGSASR